MKAIAPLCCCFLFVSLIPAADPIGEVHLTWGVSERATGYTVYWGTDGPGTYTKSALAGNRTEYDLTGLADCTTHWIATTATNRGGESGFSNEISLWPRPRLGVLDCQKDPDVPEPNHAADCFLEGVNFGPGAAVSFLDDSGQMPAGVAVLSTEVTNLCHKMEFRLVVNGGTDFNAMLPLKVQVANPGQPASRLMEASPVFVPPVEPAEIGAH